MDGQGRTGGQPEHDQHHQHDQPAQRDERGDGQRQGHGQSEDARRAQLLSAGLAQCDGALDLAALRAFVPQEWAGRAALGLDGVLRVAGRQPDDLDSRVPDDVAALLRPLVDAFGRQKMSGSAALDAVQAAHRLGAATEAAVLHASRELAARTGEDQLKLKDVSEPAELSRTARERWRRTCKSVTATEMSVLTGMGRGTARERVAIALAPADSQRAVDQALVAGIARMDLVAAWWRRCARMPHARASAVARALFATDVDPAQAAVERLTPEGELSMLPWAKNEFFKALEREALRQEQGDADAQERNRRARHERRDAFGVVDDDGTAKMVITGDTVSITACIGRVADLAARARREGDGRTEAQLRSDIARSLLLHGVLDLPHLQDEPSLITPDDIQRLVDVLSGTPSHEVQVVVPWNVLSGTAAIFGTSAVNPAPDSERPDEEASTAEASEAAPQPHSPRPRPVDNPGPADNPGVAGDPGVAGAPGAVGEILGRYGRYLSPAEVRRIAGRPGTTFYRILTDPADGRCLERSITAYAPDAAMRAQLRAADVTSRAPGSTAPAATCQLDHVTEYLLGGATGEANLQTLDVPFHALKTEKFWDAEMDASRNVTWTSFWGRLYRTRPHDYRQYLSWVIGTVPDDGEAARDVGARDEADDQLVDQRHLASLLVYAELAHRGPGSRLESDDDDPDNDAWRLSLRDAIWLRHTGSDGRKTPGPRPRTPAPNELLATDRQDLLDRHDWVEAVAEAAARRVAEESVQESVGDDGADDRTTDNHPTEDPPAPF